MMANQGQTKRRRGAGEGSIFQRENGSWCAQVRLANGKKLSKHFATRREAQQWLVESLKAKQDGLLADAGKMTVAQFLERWLDVTRPTIRPRTYESYAWLVHSHIDPTLGQLKLAALRPDHVQALYGAKSAAGLSARTVRYIHAILHRALGSG